MQGATVGHWRIEDHIGAGAMGAVYRATDVRTGARVAVKFMQADPADPCYAEAEARFAREAQVLARLRHENIVQILDSGRHGNMPYLVMEYIDAPSLREVQRMGRQFSLDDVGHLGFQLLSGLGLCHGKGVVHRDIKPSNIMVRPGDSVVLVDFGIARAETQVGITLTGAAFGTPAYMSPEQTEGQVVTPASDVWSVGVVLYELLTGQLPFGGDNPLALMNHIRLTAHPDPSVFVPELGEPIDALFRIALAKEPWARFPARAGSAGSTPALEFQKALLLAIEGAKDPRQQGWLTVLASAQPGPTASGVPPKPAHSAHAHLDRLQDELEDLRTELEAARQEMESHQPFDVKDVVQPHYGQLFLRSYFVFFVLLSVWAISLVFHQESEADQASNAMGMAFVGSLALALFYCGCDYYYRVIRAKQRSVTDQRRKMREFEHSRERYRDALNDYQAACQQFGVSP